MRKPRPVAVTRWAVIGFPNSRTRNILTHTLAYTRAESIAKYKSVWREELRPVIWRRMRRKGLTCERVTVSVARG